MDHACVEITSRVDKILEAENDDDVRKCWHSFSQLRKNILSEDAFFRRWDIQKREGYKIIFIERNSKVIAAAGYRLMNTMAWGKILYIDDLIAHESERGNGYGSILLSHLKGLAETLNCDSVHLDTGYQRHAAHKAYLRNGFTLNCHHMELSLK
jgi:GNAT superfamily N-acetyltransferase